FHWLTNAPWELEPQFTESAGAPAKLNGRVITGGILVAISRVGILSALGLGANQLPEPDS
ncbi:MAG: hypothetical protein LR097_00030, partial [Dehalococcoidia bacterium]|nr:hypothetical protein [Dehalococcoidia bacterium]